MDKWKNAGENGKNIKMGKMEMRKMEKWEMGKNGKWKIKSIFSLSIFLGIFSFFSHFFLVFSLVFSLSEFLVCRKSLGRQQQNNSTRLQQLHPTV